MDLRNWIVIDCETTGGWPRGELIELAACSLWPGTQDRFESLVRPRRRVPAVVTKLTGLDQAALGLAPEAAIVVERFLHWLPATAVLVGHNIVFDVACLSCVARFREFARTYRYVDTLPICREIWPGCDNRLQAVAARLGGAPAPLHRALIDCIVTARIVPFACKALGERHPRLNPSSWAQMWANRTGQWGPRQHAARGL